MYNNLQAPATVTLTLTPEQYDIFVVAINKAKASDLAVSAWTGETAADIEARYSIPHDAIIDDMADAYAAQYSGVPMF